MMDYGLCFDEAHTGVYAAREHGEAYLWTRLRDLVDICWLKETSSASRNEGALLVARMDALLEQGHLASRAAQNVRDDALSFIQKRTSEGLRWRISGDELSLRKF